MDLGRLTDQPVLVPVHVVGFEGAGRESVGGNALLPIASTRRMFCSMKVSHAASSTSGSVTLRPSILRLSIPRWSRARSGCVPPPWITIGVSPTVWRNARAAAVSSRCSARMAPPT